MFVNNTQIFTFISVIILFIGYLYMRYNYYVLNRDLHGDKMKGYSKMLDNFNDIVVLPNIKRITLIRSNSAYADPMFGDDYIISVVESIGEDGKSMMNEYQTVNIQMDYVNILTELGEKKEMYFETEKLDGGWLKTAAEQHGIKEFAYFHVATKRTKFMYIAISCKEIGTIKTNKAIIDTKLKEIRKLYKK